MACKDVENPSQYKVKHGVTSQLKVNVATSEYFVSEAMYKQLSDFLKPDPDRKTQGTIFNLKKKKFYQIIFGIAIFFSGYLV